MNRLSKFIGNGLLMGAMLVPAGIAQNEMERIYVRQLLSQDEKKSGREVAVARANRYVKMTEGPVNSLIHYGIRWAARNYTGEKQ